MSRWIKLLTVFGLACVFALGGFMVGCKKEEVPDTKSVGEAIGEAAEKVEEAADEVAEEVEDAAEKAAE
ncbi:MAG: hypothetical protein QF662_04935 [Phycisphaerae bacterium]|jgi:hypothetical protein|nr:hypothetical protein [Phycisphaerae bacterium]